MSTDRHDDHDDHDGELVAARTLGAALGVAAERLRAAGVTETPRLDAQVLLAHVTGAARATLLAYPERVLPAEQVAAFSMLIDRRAAGEPVAYLTGHREFMGLDLLADRRALIPRPETELLVEAALTEARARLDRGETPVVADVGTGSGAIAVALAALEPRLPRVYATDLSAEALTLAAENAARLGVADRITFLRGDLLAPLPEPVDLLLANLPYVAPRAAGELPPSVRGYEPALALYGGGEGLGHIRRLFAAAPAHLRRSAALFVEFGYDQRSGVVALASEAFPGAEVRVGTDYAGWDRYAIVRTEVAPR